MNAAVLYDGSAEGAAVIRVESAERPLPGPQEALIRVGACAVNSHDHLIRRGVYVTGRRSPHILGGDVAGTVAAYGPGSREIISVGARVVLYWQNSCGHCDPCLRDEPTVCLTYSYLGVHRDGGFAEYVSVPEQDLVQVNSGFSAVHMAALPMSFGTAWRMAITKGDVGPGDTVLVLGGASGIGLAAIQICRLAGARVIAAAGSIEKLKNVRRDWC